MSDAQGRLHVVHFSPSGTTQAVAHTFAQGTSLETAEHDLLRTPDKGVEFTPEDAAAFFMPVFAGRIPTCCRMRLEELTAKGNPAVAVVVFGNRAYDDALLELRNLLSERGFVVFAAAAFVAQHSIFPTVAQGRPDDEDKHLIASFAQQCFQKLSSFVQGEVVGQVSVPGKTPYVKPASVPLCPTASAKCTGCLACVKICPAKAINATNPRKTDKSRCFCCTACIAVCPVKARAFHTPLYAPIAKAFAAKNSSRKEGETFI